MEQEPYSFRNLALWQKGQELALQVIEMTGKLPDTVSARVMARQVVASSTSVPANIAEGHGRYSVAAYRNHLSIARGSICETETWIDLLRRAGYIDSGLEGELVRRCRELTGGLTNHMLALERKLASGGGKKIAEGAPAYALDRHLDDETE